jgi:hypothetical protein
MARQNEGSLASEEILLIIHVQSFYILSISVLLQQEGVHVLEGQVWGMQGKILHRRALGHQRQHDITSNPQSRSWGLPIHLDGVR